VDATCLVMSVGPPSRVVRGRRVSDPEGRRTAKACQRLGKTCTDRQRSVVAVITTVCAAPAERNMQSTGRSRLKHTVRRAEVFTDRLGARVSLRLPLAAG
jgi:hypothetical protein